MKYEESARRLRKAMEENGLSAQALSKISGVSKSSISEYVNGIHNISYGNSLRLAPFLKVTPEYLRCIDGINVVYSSTKEGNYYNPLFDPFSVVHKFNKLSDDNKKRAEEYIDMLLALQEEKGKP